MRRLSGCTIKKRKYMKRTGILFSILMLSAGILFSQQVTAINYDGGSVVTELGYGVKVNAQSTLMRTWIVVNDSGCPIQLGRSGIKTVYGDREYNYIPEGSASANEKVTAIDIRFLLFDIFGNHIKTLACKQVKDIQRGMDIDLKNIGSWRALENEITELLTVVNFVAQVRTSSGIIWEYDAKLIDEELLKNKLKVSKNILEPSNEK